MRTSFNCRLVVAVLGYVGLGVLESWQSSVRLVLMLIGETIMKRIPVLHQEVYFVLCDRLGAMLEGLLD